MTNRGAINPLLGKLSKSLGELSLLRFLRTANLKFAMRSLIPVAHVSLVLAGHVFADSHDDKSHRCLAKGEADDIVERWTSLSKAVNPEVAYELLSQDFTYFSDSEDFVAGREVDSNRILTLPGWLPDS